MLLAYLCSLDEGIKKHRPEALKSMKIMLQGLQNPFQKQLKSDTASEEAFAPQFFLRKFVIFQSILASKTDPKSKKKCWKRDAQKQYIFESIFIGIFFALASENRRKCCCFWDLYRKSWFCENHYCSIRKLLFFLVLNFQRWIKFRCIFCSEMTSEKWL